MPLRRNVRMDLSGTNDIKQCSSSLVPYCISVLHQPRLLKPPGNGREEGESTFLKDEYETDDNLADCHVSRARRSFLEPPGGTARENS
jgi:hypothetical protein